MWLKGVTCELNLAAAIIIAAATTTIATTSIIIRIIGAAVSIITVAITPTRRSLNNC